MLKITNPVKFWGCDVGDWRVGKVKEFDSEYQFELWRTPVNYSLTQKLTICLQKRPNEDRTYKIWYLDKLPIHNTNNLVRSADVSIEDIKTIESIINVIKALLTQ